MFIRIEALVVVEVDPDIQLRWLIIDSAHIAVTEPVAPATILVKVTPSSSPVLTTPEPAGDWLRSYVFSPSLGPTAVCRAGGYAIAFEKSSLVSTALAPTIVVTTPRPDQRFLL